MTIEEFEAETQGELAPAYGFMLSLLGGLLFWALVLGAL